MCAMFCFISLRCPEPCVHFELQSAAVAVVFLQVPIQLYFTTWKNKQVCFIIAQSTVNVVGLIAQRGSFVSDEILGSSHSLS